jgi:hypothetical protein
MQLPQVWSYILPHSLCISPGKKIDSSLIPHAYSLCFQAIPETLSFINNSRTGQCRHHLILSSILQQTPKPQFCWTCTFNQCKCTHWYTCTHELGPQKLRTQSSSQLQYTYGKKWRQDYPWYPFLTESSHHKPSLHAEGAWKCSLNLKASPKKMCPYNGSVRSKYPRQSWWWLASPLRFNTGVHPSNEPLNLCLWFSSWSWTRRSMSTRISVSSSELYEYVSCYGWKK